MFTAAIPTMPKHSTATLPAYRAITSGLITISENKISLDFHVIVSYGVSISAVTDNLINNVKYKVEEFTGMEIEKINILVEGVRVID